MMAINIGIFSMFIGLGFTLQGFMDLIHLPVSSQRENEEGNLLVSSGYAMNWNFNAVLELKLLIWLEICLLLKRRPEPVYHET